jgi:hypothetical protein
LEPGAGDLFNLFDWGSLSGAFDTVNLPALGGGLSWNTSQLYTNGTLLVVPEPNSAALLLAGLAPLMLKRLRGPIRWVNAAGSLLLLETTMASSGI